MLSSFFGRRTDIKPMIPAPTTIFSTAMRSAYVTSESHLKGNFMLHKFSDITVGQCGVV
jgi:hypothetical protein